MPRSKDSPVIAIRVGVAKKIKENISGKNIEFSALVNEFLESHLEKEDFMKEYFDSRIFSKILSVDFTDGYCNFWLKEGGSFHVYFKQQNGQSFLYCEEDKSKNCIHVEYVLARTEVGKIYNYSKSYPYVKGVERDKEDEKDVVITPYSKIKAEINIKLEDGVFAKYNLIENSNFDNKIKNQWQKADLLFVEKKYEQSRKIYQELLRLTEDDPPKLSKTHAVELLHAIGKTHFRERNLDLALEELGRAIEEARKQDRKNPHLWNDYGYFLFRKAMKENDKEIFRKALANFEMAHSIKKDDNFFIYNIIMTSLRLGTKKDLDVAEGYVKKFKEDSNFEPLVEIGRFYKQARNYEKALDLFQSAIDSIHKNVDISKEKRDEILANVFVLQGNTLFHQGRYKEACQSFINGRNIEPTNPDCWAGFALCLVQPDNPEKENLKIRDRKTLESARDAVNKALSYDKHHPKANEIKSFIEQNLFNLGFIEEQHTI
ncbi:Tetratricopeptide repeat protein [Candidatus Nitrosocosmicus oleophilus]|uniref:Tetratricopeptide repeat protein n=1 Tax=Candidatus Nitrosocosmicus oleophilus TaxID=1353260 RepID=A0A654LYV6_9ARCH|nr:tetratricopeptide repeat protein [Candidatus Nitrosocosmicus oleophilus]ALI35419.1 Tetratricopeptide repeat protein [Candidatus Nitrosocosmicus oleophilus]